MDPFLVTLRCQTVVDSVLAYAEMPVALEVWGEASEVVRDHLRSQVRTELRISVGARLGEAQLDDRYDTLPVWEQHADRCEVECVGGPCDGERIKFGTAEPPHSLVLPAPFKLEYLPTSAVEPADLLPTLMYRPLPDEHGFFSRTADGAWRFGVVSSGKAAT